MKSTPRFFRPASGLVLFLAAIGPSCAKPAADASETIPDGIREREVPPVRPCTVERREMVRVLETTSRLESDSEVQIFSELPGRAVEILVEEGDRVKKGDVLARLDHRDEDLAVADAEVALEEARENAAQTELKIAEARDSLAQRETEALQAERDWKRDEELFSSSDLARPLSQQALEARRLQKEQAEHAVEQARIALERSMLEKEQSATAVSRAQVALDRARLTRRKKDIVAPFDGVISLRNIRIGDSVGTAQAAFVLTDTDHLRALFSRPQEELRLFSDLRPSDGGEGEDGGLAIQATTEAYPDRSFEGYVERISPTIDATSGQFRVVARLREAEGTDRVLLPGMLVRMKIITARHPDALVIPKRALRREGERRFVLELVDGPDGTIVRRVPVEEGFQDEEYVEVIPVEEGALDAGTRLVLIGSRDLVDGDPVRVDELGDATETVGEDSTPR
ncbi:MAG TPA: efflux RND transporter periplasmic adaptor subunit [Planctomycetes bacterium]|nr:efflux RND transporter periplasmic adaptor subunit [Planctomycetota bacterium]